MQLVDLTQPLDPKNADIIPEPAKSAAAVTCPKVLVPCDSPGRGADVLIKAFGCTHDDLPNGEGMGDEWLEICTHLGTHVDAPLHYGTTCEGKPSRTIGDIGLEELFCDGIVLDVRDNVLPGKGISVDALERAVDKVGVEIKPGSAIMVRTGQDERYTLADMEYFYYPGMTREGTLYLAELGGKVLGIDTLGWDRPFPEMIRAFKETKDPSHIWDGHFAGRDKEVFIVQQMANLHKLPASGFKVGFFPLYFVGMTAAPARVVAFLD